MDGQVSELNSKLTTLTEQNQKLGADLDALEQIRIEKVEIQLQREKVKQEGVDEYLASDEYIDSFSAAFLDQYSDGVQQAVRVLAATGKYTARQLAQILVILANDPVCHPGHALVPIRDEVIEKLREDGG